MGFGYGVEVFCKVGWVGFEEIWVILGVCFIVLVDVVGCKYGVVNVVEEVVVGEV